MYALSSISRAADQTLLAKDRESLRRGRSAPQKIGSAKPSYKLTNLAQQEVTSVAF